MIYRLKQKVVPKKKKKKVVPKMAFAASEERPT